MVKASHLGKEDPIFVNCKEAPLKTKNNNRDRTTSIYD